MSRSEQPGKARGKSSDGAIDPPMRLIAVMMALGMIVGALTAPDAADPAAGESAIASFTNGILSIFAP